ncbi:putative DNA-binding protein (MmcQ/YjbR family) [Flavimobilis soli]|uniref:Putative DNA-binding protein (MmcQ/YjbR family) n=1 Tax=Flavimobilis soli TaxID=442709 RepID=A0A2A9EGF6_9MICO|nr:MmcQ/YjbR family DNA-binding protein [Flavimobilis soli]PFG37345.1 putative DNA-binding protein (MmcQ/YjbR family) [Flavimobilis soli]
MSDDDAPELSPEAQGCRALCLDLPDATSDFPFGTAAEAFRVRRKIFALVTRHPKVGGEHWHVNLKADPELVPGLVAAHEDVLPGWHQNKRHWVSVVLHPDLDRELLEQLVEDSYDLVVSGLPVSKRPMTH